MEEVQLITILDEFQVWFMFPMYTFVCSMQKCDAYVFVYNVFLCTVILINF